MSKDWEKALLSKAEELLYNEIMNESENSNQQSQLYLLLLYFAMQMKYPNRENNSLNDQDLQTLLHDMRELQDLQEKRLRDFDMLAVEDS